MNINSVLPTSPLPFNATQRATSPSDMFNTTKPPALSSTMSNLASFGANIVSKTGEEEDEDDIDWSKKKKNKTTKATKSQLQSRLQSSSNSQLYIEYSSSSAASSKNPFLDSTIPQEQSSSLPRPPSRRHSQSPPGVTTATNSSPLSTQHVNSNSVSSITHHHRRNMSDTSAFTNKKNINASQLKPPQLTTHQTTVSVRSLNPFDDSVGNSYEDQLFGHEFDKIRQENSHLKNHQLQPSTIPQQSVQDQSSKLKYT